MSKYDVEVESRLQALEKAVKELQNHSHGGNGDIDPEQFKGLHEDVARLRKTLGI